MSNELITKATEEVTMYALNIAEDGRVLSATYPKYAPADAVLVEHLPTGETEAEQDIHNWRYTQGGFVYDPLPEAEEVPSPTIEQRVESLELSSAELIEALDLLLSGVTE